MGDGSSIKFAQRRGFEKEVDTEQKTFVVREPSSVLLL